LFLEVDHLQVPFGFPPSIGRILEEFRTLNIERYPNAALDLVRTLLEKTVKAYAESQQQSLKPKGNSGYVYLSNCLDWLEDWFKNHGPKAHVQVVKKLRSTEARRDPLGAHDLMNAINHNHHVFATPQEVRDTWDAMKGLLAEMLK
jgi:hypothetical protein